MIGSEKPLPVKEALENLVHPRDNDSVIAGQYWVDGWQAARLLGLQAHHC